MKEGRAFKQTKVSYLWATFQLERGEALTSNVEFVESDVILLPVFWYGITRDKILLAVSCAVSLEDPYCCVY